MTKDKIINHGNGLIEYINYHGNGLICDHYSKLNNELHGECRRYNKYGRLYAHNYYKNKKQEGERLEYKYL